MKRNTKRAMKQIDRLPDADQIVSVDLTVADIERLRLLLNGEKVNGKFQIDCKLVAVMI